MKSRKFHPFAALAVLAATTSAASAITGGLDASFGASGIATASYGGTDSANAVAIMSNGKIVVAGTTNSAGSNDIAVLRYNANGSLDTSFDHDGGVITDIGALTDDSAAAVAVQPDGKILVAGKSGNDSVVVRYNSNGTLDTFFGANGRRIISGSSTDAASSLILLNTGKILVGGTCFIGAQGNFYVTRLNSDGSTDPSFNSGFINEVTFGDEEVCTSMALQPDGKIVLAGYSNAVTTNDFAIARFTAAGVLDTTFDTDGKVTTNFGSDDRAYSVLVQPNGGIVAGGQWSGGASDFALVRYNSNGSLDSSFGGDGTVNAAFTPTGFGLQDFAHAMVRQSDGKIVIAGYTNQFDASNDIGIMRFNVNGTLDTTFNADGKVTTAIGAGTADRANAISLQSDGRLVVVGSSAGDFAAVRYSMKTRVDARIGANNKANSGNNIYNNTGAGQTLNVTIPKKGGKKNSFIRIQNDGDSTENFTISGGSGNSNFSVRYLNGNSNVTTDVLAGTFNTGSLAPGATFLLKVEIVAKTKKANKNFNLSITGKAASDASNVDKVVVKAKSK